MKRTEIVFSSVVPEVSTQAVRVKHVTKKICKFNVTHT